MMTECFLLSSGLQLLLCSEDKVTSEQASSVMVNSTELDQVKAQHNENELNTNCKQPVCLCVCVIFLMCSGGHSQHW